MGNRTNQLGKYSPVTEDGKVMMCPLCKEGKNDELHLVIKCKKLSAERRKYKLLEGISLIEWIQNNNEKSDDEKMKLFFGNLRQNEEFYMDRGLCLVYLRKSFFLHWSEICGETISCSLEL